MFNIALNWLAGFFAEKLQPAEAAASPESPAESATENSADAAVQAHNRVAATYRNRISELQQQLSRALIQRTRAYAYLAASLVATASFLYLYSGPHFLPLWASWLPVLAMLAALNQAQKCGRQVREASRLRNFYNHRLQCVQHEWMGNGDPGAGLENAKHLSASDLDLFGKGSMFELLCDVGTPAGRDTLARWLQAPAPPEEVILRQQAVQSLTDQTTLQERLALARTENTNEYPWERLCAWLVADPMKFPRWAPWVALLLSLCMVAPAACGVLGFLSAHETLRAMALIGIPEGVLALYLHARVRAASEGLVFSSSQLESAREMCKLLESERMESPLLVRMQQRIRGASEHISRLQRMVQKRELRDNEWFFWLLLLLAWKTQWTMRIERWRIRHGRGLMQYLITLGEFEALIAIATYAYENRADVYPEIVKDGPLFEATGMGHPLMNARLCVRNDLKLGGTTSFLLITGSNMSGKSTLLRAAGLNATLAWMGAPVRATHLRLSPLQVCASIRINDSLMDGRSHFYAEVERLKAAIDCAASHPPVLFLIDELFAGTNSADRRIAAEAVIRLLVERHAIGLVTSHDLSLTEIAEKLELKGINVHFAHLPSTKSLGFDYHLRPGKVEQSNALTIIRMIGIPVD